MGPYLSAFFALSSALLVDRSFPVYRRTRSVAILLILWPVVGLIYESLLLLVGHQQYGFIIGREMVQ